MDHTWGTVGWKAKHHHRRRAFVAAVYMTVLIINWDKLPKKPNESLQLVMTKVMCYKRVDLFSQYNYLSLRAN